MSGPASPAPIELPGAVSCRQRDAFLTLSCAPADGPLSVHLACIETALLPQLPAVLHDVQLREQPVDQAAGGRRIELTARELRCSLPVHSLQVHRDVSREFQRAVPPARVPLLRRAGWPVLLLLLRMPWFVQLLKRLRGSP